MIKTDTLDVFYCPKGSNLNGITNTDKHSAERTSGWVKRIGAVCYGLFASERIAKDFESPNDPIDILKKTFPCAAVAKVNESKYTVSMECNVATFEYLNSLWMLDKIRINGFYTSMILPNPSRTWRVAPSFEDVKEQTYFGKGN